VTDRLIKLLGVLALAVLSAGVAACGGSSGGGGGSSSSSSGGTKAVSANAKPKSGTTINMGIEPWIGYGPWYVAQAQGCFKQQGLNVKIVNFGTDAQREAAFVGGKTDVSNMPTHTALLFEQKGVDAKAILAEDESLTADAVLAKPPITSIKQLKGKKVAYEQGTTSDILIHYALAANHMSESDVQVVPVNASDAGPALIAGRVDAAVTYEPYVTTAMKQGAKRIFAAAADPGLVSDVLVAHSSLIQDNPGALVALAKCWGKAIDYYNANTTKAQAIIAKGVGAKPSDLATSFKGVKLYSLSDNVTQLTTGPFVNKVMPDVEKAALAAKFLPSKVDPKALFDPSVVKAAAGQ
jgi:NitT/TauT family transport system substrate-binding protein